MINLISNKCNIQVFPRTFRQIPNMVNKYATSPPNILLKVEPILCDQLFIKYLYVLRNGSSVFIFLFSLFFSSSSCFL